MATLAGRTYEELKGRTMDQKSDRRSARGNRRLKPRFIHPPVECDLGRVIDLSAEGLRVEVSQRRKLRVGDSVKLMLGKEDVPVRVVWIKRRFMKRTAGLAFESVSPELREMLGSIVAQAISTTAWFDGEPRSAA